jgi:iron complex outermembrane receptor protein
MTVHRRNTRSVLLGATALAGALAIVATPATAQQARYDFNLPAQPLETALEDFARTANQQLIFADADVRGRKAPPVSGTYSPDDALGLLLAGTDLKVRRTASGVVQIAADADPQGGSAAGGGAEVEALIVTAQKREEDIQDVPIAISAFSQEDLTRSQIAGGPDLMTQVPNMTFTKTNFSSYSIQIRGIGTQAISATVDPAVAVAFNNTPFIRNRFFEQEFYDLQRVEVLRGPQGTLYGRNATAGVVNIISAKPSFEYAQKLSADVGNYKTIRLEGMINMPLAEDKAALRIAGAWTKRDGYTTNQITGNPIDGRDLWSTRVSLRLEPTETIRANLIWEHFEEDDDRLRSGKQLCKKHTPETIGGAPVPGYIGFSGAVFSQGCVATSMYSPEAFQTPNGYSLPYFAPLAAIGSPVTNGIDPYTSLTQSQDLRVIESTRDPEYRASSDIAQLQVEVDLTPALSIASETAYSTDELFSTQDFNRFNTKPGAFHPGPTRPGVLENGIFCDPQVGCSDRMVLVDLSTAKSSHFSQEFRLSSDFDGPFNFSLGANFLRYDTEDKYYVFINTLTVFAATASWTGDTGAYDVTSLPWVPNVSDNSECLRDRRPPPPDTVSGDITGCIYFDPNPIGSLNDLGHNYFLSKNPYKLISYAAFGEAYYNITPSLKVTAGLRWTVDKKDAPRIPSWLMVAETYGYPVIEVVEQDWREPTGRLTVDWKPDLAFTDETLVYASYAHGYKAGGMNPPPAVLALYQGFEGLADSLIQPKTFDAEFIDAYEIGTKNTLLDGRVTFNASAFYYDYHGYQLSQIINRSAVTQNFDAEVMGVEIEADWRPLENLRLGFRGGYQDTRVGDGESAIDLIDRTAGNPDWVVARPFPTVPSNCIVPVWLVSFNGSIRDPGGQSVNGVCITAYMQHLDPVTGHPYVPDPVVDNGTGPDWTGYPGFDPDSAPNNGEGFAKDLSGNELPNAPHFTTTLTADYTLPLPNEWLMTLHADYYRQSKAWTRIYNFDPYDRLKPYTNVNLAAIFTNEDAGWKVMAYVKNVFDNDAITGAFLNSDDTGLTTNVFLLEPRLYGLRVTREWNGSPLFGGLLGERLAPGEPYPFTVEIGGQVQRHDAPNAELGLDFVDNFSEAIDPRPAQGQDLDWGDGRDIRLTYRPQGGAWKISAGARFGRTNKTSNLFAEEAVSGHRKYEGHPSDQILYRYNYTLTTVKDHEEHMLVDFAVGRDVGLGAFGEGGSSAVSVAFRHAKFNSTTNAEINGTPDHYIAAENVLKYPLHHTQYVSSSTAERSFEGAGPVLSWEASKRLKGGDEAGHLDLDWALSAGVLFGKQKTAIHEEGNAVYDYFFILQYPAFHNARESLMPADFNRSESVNAPTFGASLGLSYQIDRIKIGAGYRWERYFDVLDGGREEQQAVDRTIDGPYFKLSLGFGG